MEVEILTRGKPTHPNPVRRPPSGSPWPAAGRRRRPGRGLAAHGCAWPRAWRPRAWPRAPGRALAARCCRPARERERDPGSKERERDLGFFVHSQEEGEVGFGKKREMIYFQF